MRYRDSIRETLLLETLLLDPIRISIEQTAPTSNTQAINYQSRLIELTFRFDISMRPYRKRFD